MSYPDKLAEGSAGNDGAGGDRGLAGVPAAGPDVEASMLLQHPISMKMAGDDVNDISIKLAKEDLKRVHVELAKAKEILDASIVVQRWAKRPRWKKDVLEGAHLIEDGKRYKPRRRLTKKGKPCKE